MISQSKSGMSPSKKAHRTAKWARIMTKWLITYSQRRGARWNLVEFGGKTGSESRGVVDLIAIRKDHKKTQEGIKRGDLFDIVLIQTKGGGARSPSSSDIERLRRVASHHRARAIVLAEWIKGNSPVFYLLSKRKWQEVDPVDVFG